jgi:hypothetical protein
MWWIDPSTSGFSDELIAGRRSDVKMNDPVDHKTNR